MKLSLLIPVLKEHKDKFNALFEHLQKQYNGPDVEVLTCFNNGEKTKGEYRNELLESANGEYLAFIDADDWVSEFYIPLILKALESNPTHLSLKGVYTVNGQNPEVFEHSIKYSEWKTNPSGPVKYERNINHLNVIKSYIAKKFKYPEKNHGEDFDYSLEINKSGLLTNEEYIDSILYLYRYVKK